MSADLPDELERLRRVIEQQRQSLSSAEQQVSQWRARAEAYEKAVEPFLGLYSGALRLEGDLVVQEEPLLTLKRRVFQDIYRVFSKTPQPVVVDPEGPEIEGWCDGSGTTAESPAACGVVLHVGADRFHRGYPLGKGTNNFAEVSAILRSLVILKDELKVPQESKVILYSDSAFAIGAVTEPWNVKTNVDLIERTRDLVAYFPRLRLQHVPGHAGIAGNEAADRLAKAAVLSQGLVVSLERALEIIREHKAALRKKHAKSLSTPPVGRRSHDPARGSDLRYA